MSVMAATPMYAKALLNGILRVAVLCTANPSLANTLEVGAYAPASNQVRSKDVEHTA